MDSLSSMARAVVAQVSRVPELRSRMGADSRLFRGLISLGTTVILAGTLLIDHSRAPLVDAALVSAIAIAVLYTALRLHISAVHEEWLYQPLVQVVRSQTGIIGTTVLIGVFAAHGLIDHALWPLYIIALLSLSERTDTVAVPTTLVEVSLLFWMSSYIGYSIHAGPHSLLTFTGMHPQVPLRIVWIWLITFTLYYLVHNIRSRARALVQSHDVIRLLDVQLRVISDCTGRRQAIVDAAQDITDARARLFVPRVIDGHLVGLEGEDAPALAHQAAMTRRVLIVRYAPFLSFVLDQIITALSWPAPYGTGNDPQFIQQAPEYPDAQAQLVVPILASGGSTECLGVLELLYLYKMPSPRKLIVDSEKLGFLAGQIKTVLAGITQQEQQDLLDLLASRWYGLGLDELAQQVVDDVVDVLGFDLATLSMVDTSQNLVRTMAGRNADWVDDARHPLMVDDVQALVVREGRVYRNDGPYASYLDRSIWSRYRHRDLCRVWVPIKPTRAWPGEGEVLGTIEAGFCHARYASVPGQLESLLAECAERLYPFLANAQHKRRQDDLVEALTALQEANAAIQQAMALREPFEMADLLGHWAERILAGEIVMLYELDDRGERLDLLYCTGYPESIVGKPELDLNLASSRVLYGIYREKSPYYASDAQSDPLLAHIATNGRDSRNRRTFTQRQNIKSFAGLPLLSKGGRVIGFLCVNYRRRHEFHAEERRILELYAAMTATALVEVGNQRQVRRQLVLGERIRYSVVLHENLRQQFYALRFRLGQAVKYGERGDAEATMDSLLHAQEVAKACASEVQRLLDELNRDLPQRAQFVPDLESRFDLLEREHGLRIEFAPSVQAELSYEVQFYLLRIALEALNNAARHGGKNVRIVYDVDERGAVRLNIEDDGPGFDAEHLYDGHYGLSIMRNHADILGGSLDLISQPGKGTCVSLCIAAQAQRRTT
jgi:signal transduction histidine kinase